MNKISRNLIIFSVVTFGGGWVGVAVDQVAPGPNPMQGLGVLIWLTSPLVAVLLLRAFGGDGWQDFGLAPKLKSGWRWYVVAVLLAPVVTLLLLGIGLAVGAIALDGLAEQGVSALLRMIGIGFMGAMVKNIFEEFAWRGYLTPRFVALKVNPFGGYLLTGLIWAGWHLPYWFYFLDRAELLSHTSLSLPAFIALGFILLPLHAIVYGELRLLSGSVWPVWLLHNIANALSLTLLTGGFVVLDRGLLGMLLSPGTEGVLFTLIMALMGVRLYQYRQKQGVAGETTRKFAQVGISQ